MKNKDLLNKILYRSKHRGCKETDFLIGKFVEANLAKFNDDEILLLADFIEEDDMKIYDWILNKITVDEIYQKLVRDIQNYHKI